MIFFIFLLSTCFCHCDYPYRNIHEPIIQLDNDIQVIQIAGPRTGSTLIFNVLNYLFEDKNYDWESAGEMRVRKKHSFHRWSRLNKKHLYLIQTIRDPLNIIVSQYLKDKTVKLRTYDPMSMIHRIKKLNRHTFKHLVLRYEDFDHDNFTYIFTKLEEFFHVTIPAKEKNKIQEMFCLKAMKKISDKQGDFSSIDPYTQVHGNHINHSDFSTFFSYRQAKKIYQFNYGLRKKWGYPDLNLKKIYQITASEGN